MGLPDQRPWLDHGRWGVQHPLGTQAKVPPPSAPYPFLTAEGESLHQIAVGPVHAGIIEPGHFRFTASGETVARLEERLGYVHKGTRIVDGRSEPGSCSQLAGRVSGDSTVAYSIAFAHAVEAALDVKVPRRAAWLRALMAELERIANHFGDFGAICNDASFALMHAQCGMLRELTLRAAAANFGHRLMMDCVVPGGVSADLRPDGATQVRALLAEIGRLFEVGGALRQHRVTAGSHRDEGRLHPLWRANSGRAAMSDARPAAPSMRAEPSPIRLTANSNSTCRSSKKATSMRACGFASARSNKASH